VLSFDSQQLVLSHSPISSVSMSSTPVVAKDEVEEIPPPQRPPSPPLYTTFTARGVHVGNKAPPPILDWNS
jgi:hypothetical protein